MKDILYGRLHNLDLMIQSKSQVFKLKHSKMEFQYFYIFRTVFSCTEDTKKCLKHFIQICWDHINSDKKYFVQSVS